MTQLPASPDLSHLKEQAKDLLRDARAGESTALERFAAHLSAIRGRQLSEVARERLQLHDAQSALAREYGFLSWTELKRYVEWKQASASAQASGNLTGNSLSGERLANWLAWAYDGNAQARRLAARMVREEPELFDRDPWLACSIGNAGAVLKAVAQDADWVNRPGGALGMPPLIAVTHSKLILEEGFAAGLLACAELLLQHGAKGNATWIDARFPDSPLSALYGATGKTHHIAMTRLLLEAGANPNDNESLYHSVESPDPAISVMLLQAGAKVTGTNAIGRVLDYDKLDLLRLLLAHGGDAAERPWIHHAILRGRSIEHIRALANAGADLRAIKDGISLYRYAQLRGRQDVVEMLREAGVEESLSEMEQFLAACSYGDENAARKILERTPDIFSKLTEKQLQIMPELAATGNLRAVATMLAVGWPREIPAGWGASALNLAVFEGHATMADLLLANGADWRTKHSHNDNVFGTLSYASQAEDIGDPAKLDYLGCARALIRHGVPLPESDVYKFSPEVTEYFDGLRLNMETEAISGASAEGS